MIWFFCSAIGNIFGCLGWYECYSISVSCDQVVEGLLVGRIFICVSCDQAVENLHVVFLKKILFLLWNWSLADGRYGGVISFCSRVDLVVTEIGRIWVLVLEFASFLHLRCWMWGERKNFLYWWLIKVLERFFLCIETVWGLLIFLEFDYLRCR